MVRVCNVLAYLTGPVALAEPPWVAVGTTVTAVLLLTAREKLPPRCPGWVETSCPCLAPPGIACDHVSWFG
jgi:hypothetical protein